MFFTHGQSRLILLGRRCLPKHKVSSFEIPKPRDQAIPSFIDELYQKENSIRLNHTRPTERTSEAAAKKFAL